MSFAAAATAVGGVVKLGMSLAGRKKRIAEQKAAKKEMEKQKRAFEALDTSNPYKNMENKMEDLTVNQQEAEFASQKAAQNRANVMQQMKGAAGGSGIAALAQQMANQGSLDAQKAAVSIGKQESANQMAERKEAAQIQTKEREGEVKSREWEKDKVSTLLGMAQQRKGAADQARADAMKDQMGAVGDIAKGAFSAAGDGKMEED